MKDEVLPPGLANVYKSGDQVVDRTMAVTWRAPANMVLNVTVTPVDRAAVWQTSTQTLHLFTPETESSTHYFYVGSLPRSTADEQTADRFYTALSTAFLNEDKPMIDAQAKMIGAADIMSLKPALLAPDKAAVLARRMLARRIADERA
jgi:vanillate O-demethylase monooxygenase subunit